MYREELTEIAKVVWDAVTQMPLEPCEPAPVAAESDTVTVFVRVSGAWNGSVSATVTTDLGRKIASAMLDVAPSLLSDADIGDALLEVVNMLGGNFKALLPPVCQLSLPCIVTAATETRGTVEGSVSFVCQEQPVEIAVRSLPPLAS